MNKTMFEKITSSKEAFVDWLLSDKKSFELPEDLSEGVEAGAILVDIGVAITLLDCDGNCDECDQADECECEYQDECEACEAEDCFSEMPVDIQEQIRDALLAMLDAEVQDD